MPEACRPFGLSIASRAKSTAALLEENGEFESRDFKAFSWRPGDSRRLRPTSLDFQKGNPNVYVHPASPSEPISRSPSHFTSVGSLVQLLTNDVGNVYADSKIFNVR